MGEVRLTSRLAYFRFHGRNAREWWTGNRETRYNYLYSPQELGELSEEVKDVSDRTENSYVFYNNHYGAKAVVNALQTRLWLGQPVAEGLPETLTEHYPLLKSVPEK